MTLSRLHLALLGLAASLLPVTAAAQTTWHVDAAAAPGGDGLAWSTALDSLDDALTGALAGDQIWVRAGVYRPTLRTVSSDPRSVTFAVAMGVPLYGGFDGTETTLGARAGDFDQTILSGDVGVPGVDSDNAWHVVWANNPSGIPSDYTTIDGFTIRDGNAVGTPSPIGGGLLVWNSALILRNCIVRDNRAAMGAGLRAEPGMVWITWCEFFNNHATEKGGAIWGRAFYLKVSHCRFWNNSATRGGAFYVTGSHGGGPPGDRVAFFDSVFHDNRAVEGGVALLGGGAYTAGGAAFHNCTLAYNRASDRGGAILARGGTIAGLSRLENCIVWGNRAPIGANLDGRHVVAFSNIEGGEYVTGGNLCVDPGFVDGPHRDLHLLPGSPCHDVGSNERIGRDFADADGDGIYLEPISIDLDGRRRVADDPLAPNPGGAANPLVDLGAYER